MMKLRTGDQVKIIAGKEKGKSGKVIQVFPDDQKVVVEGMNLMTKHLRAPRRGEKGQKVSFSAPIDASNVMVVCGKCGKPTRVAIRLLENGSRVRTCRRCKEAIV